MVGASLPLSLIVVLLIAHWCGDFVAQSDWMAVNKSKRWDVLAIHVGVYTLVLWPFVVFTPADASLFVAVNAAAHFVQDAITSRITARLWFIELEKRGTHAVHFEYYAAVLPTRHWFFVAIGADQLLHYVTLFVTAGWWLR